MWEFGISLGKNLKIEGDKAIVTLTYTFNEISETKFESSSSVEDEIDSEQEDDLMRKFS